MVHDYISEFGGAERVLKALTELFPQAPIYTAFKIKGSTAAKEFSNKKIIESKYAFLVKHGKLYSPLRFLAPKIWQSFDLQGFDVIISSASWYITKGFKVSKNALNICYCHTPPRYLYGYKTSLEWQRYWPIKLYATIINKYLRQYDFTSAQKVDFFLANSKNIQARISKFYRRDSEIVYPPVKLEEIKKACKNLKPKDYYLLVSRVVGAKGISLALKTANKLNIKLKIVGEPAGLRWQEKDFQKLKNKNIEFIGRVEDKKLWQLYGECKAFLALAEDEDFGITPVEAMAAGRPVIAFNGGGYQETVINGKTGIFFNKPEVASLSQAIVNLKKMDIKRIDCQSQAKKFSENRFKKEIKDFILKKTASKF
ncbi:glycosyltransferase [Patescibacteria group bacterium]